MKSEQYSPELKWYKLSCVMLYIDFNTFELLSDDKYVLWADEGIANPLSILSFNGDDLKKGGKSISNILWLNNITVNGRSCRWESSYVSNSIKEESSVIL